MTEPSIQSNPFSRQWAATGEAVLDATRRVGESGWYVLGQEVAAFERELADRQGRRHAVGCASGLDAIEIALRAVDLRPGERVLTTPLSAFATTLAIVRAGGIPVFVDVDPSGLLDLERAADCLDAHPDIRTMVPVHLFGHAIDLDELAAVKARFELRVIEDCAQAIGARSRGRPVGDVGEASAFSFYPTKNLGAIGDGGAIALDDDELARTCRVLRDYGQSDKYRHDELGLNSRLDELHAAILRSALLPNLDGWTLRRTMIAERYHSGLEVTGLTIPPRPSGSDSVWHLFPVMVPAAERASFLAHMRAAGVQVGVHYPILITEQRALANTAGVLVHGDLGNARALATQEVSLPIHPLLQDEEIDRVIEVADAWTW